MNEGQIIWKYLRDCEALRLDLSLLRDDVRRGDTVRYAVDFAEVLAYVKPRPTSDFSMFSDDSSSANAEIERAALQQVLFGTEHPLVILPPYALELQAFEAELATHASAEFATAAAAAAEELDALANDPEFANLEAVVVGQHAESESLDRAVHFLEDRAPGILVLLNQSYVNPLRRLRLLLRSGRLTTLSLLLGTVVEPRQDVVDQWYTTLRRARDKWAPAAASRLDSIAIGVVSAVNDAEHGFSLALITRSKYMHEVAVDLDMRNVLRHPRTFVAFAGLGEALPGPKDGNRVLTERDVTDRALARMLDSLDAFMDVARGVHFSDLDPAAGVMIKERLDRIKSEWHSAVRLRGAMAHPSVASSEGDVHHRISEVIALVTGRSNLREALQARLAHLSREVAENHQMLGVLLEQSPRNEPVYSIEPQADLGSVAFPATQAVPYALQFFSEGVLRWYNKFEVEQVVRWSDLREFVAASIDHGADYETLLAVAYMFGVLNRWAVAERYCQLSLEYANEAALPHEGKFFLAVCMRKDNPTFERLLNAVDLLGEASRIKRLRIDSAAYDDPRYLKELAYLIFVMNRIAASGDPGAHADLIPTQSAIELCERVAVHADSTPNLRAQACNNVLYYYLEDAFLQKEAIGIVQRYYALLVETLDGAAAEAVPPWIRHTLALARWRVPSLRGNATLEDIANELAALAIAPELSRDERREIRRHVSEIRRSQS